MSKANDLTPDSSLYTDRSRKRSTPNKSAVLSRDALSQRLEPKATDRMRDQAQTPASQAATCSMWYVAGLRVLIVDIQMYHNTGHTIHCTHRSGPQVSGPHLNPRTPHEHWERPSCQAKPFYDTIEISIVLQLVQHSATPSIKRDAASVVRAICESGGSVRVPIEPQCAQDSPQARLDMHHGPIAQLQVRSTNPHNDCRNRKSRSSRAILSLIKVLLMALVVRIRKLPKQPPNFRPWPNNLMVMSSSAGLRRIPRREYATKRARRSGQKRAHAVTAASTGQLSTNAC